MKSIYFKILFVCLLVFGGRVSYGQTICYEAYNSFTGFNLDSYQNIDANSALNQKACALTTLINSVCDNGNNDNFKIFGGAFNPTLAYTDLIQYQLYEDQFNATIEVLSQNNDSYLFLGKEIRRNDTGGEFIFFRIELKLPSCSPELQGLTVFEQETIKSMVLEAINEEATLNSNSIPSAKESEIVGLEKLTTFIQQISDGTFEISVADALAANGFKEIELTEEVASVNYTYDTDCGVANFEGETLMVSDYACIKINDNSIKTQLDNSLQSENENDIQFIITSNVMTDYQSRLDFAETKYDNKYNYSYLYWMHFVLSDNEIKVFYKTRTNNDVVTAQANIDAAYDDWMTAEGEEEIALHGDEGGFRATSCTDGSVYCVPDHLTVEQVLDISYKDLKTWRAYCCRMDPDEALYSPESFHDGVTYGVMDGLWQTICFIYDTNGGIEKVDGNIFIGWFVPGGGGADIFIDFIKKIKKEGEFVKGVMAKFGDDWKQVVNIKDSFVHFLVNLPAVITAIKASISQFMGDLNPLNGLQTTGYSVGVLLFEVIMEIATGGGKTFFTASESAFKILRKIGKNPASLLDDVPAAFRNLSTRLKATICKIRYGRCFLAGTSVFASNSTFIPIQDIQIGQSVYANTWVNQYHQTTSSTQQMAIPEWKDPHTSDEQRRIDELNIKNEEWYLISMKLENESGTAKLIRPKQWLTDHNIQLNTSSYISLPEQNIYSLANVTEISPFIFSNNSIDENINDDFELRPVTGIFERKSNDVWILKFDTGDSLGVTAPHPIYSLDYDDWRTAGELQIGEKVLTKSKHSIVTSKEKLLGVHTVYNLEVRGLHNFLVGNQGIVVHNSYPASFRAEVDHLRAKYAENPAGIDGISDPFVLDVVRMPETKYLQLRDDLYFPADFTFNSGLPYSSFRLDLTKAWGSLFPDELLRKNTDKLTKVENYANDFGKSFDDIGDEFINVPTSQKSGWVDHLEYRTKSTGKVNKAGDRAADFNAFENTSDVPSKYTSDTNRFNDLARDPDQGGAIKISTRREATAGLELESQGILNDITRGPKGIEFYDINRTPWDVKTPTGNYFKVTNTTEVPPGSRGIGDAIFDELTKSKTIDGVVHPPGQFIDDISGVAKNKHVILDSSYISPQQLELLREWLANSSGLTSSQLSRIVEVNILK